MDLLFRSKGILFLLPFFAFSCVAPKELTYFQTEEGQEWQQVQTITNAIEVVIQPGDQLVIIVSSFDPMAVAPFNRDNGNYSRDGNAGGFARNRQNTYRVDQQGNIDFPVIGSMNLNELSLDEAEGILRAQINNYVKDPVVSIEFSSLRVTVLGEVGRRGIISTTKDRLSIIEAIGQAGDISDFGNRSNVLLIREENGKREIARLNLLTVDIFNSPYYYLKQNDIIYVEPDRRKSINLSSNQTNRIVSLVTSVTSLTALLIALFGT